MRRSAVSQGQALCRLTLVVDAIRYYRTASVCLRRAARCVAIHPRCPNRPKRIASIEPRCLRRTIRGVTVRPHRHRLRDSFPSPSISAACAELPEAMPSVSAAYAELPDALKFKISVAQRQTQGGFLCFAICEETVKFFVLTCAPASRSA